MGAENVSLWLRPGSKFPLVVNLMLCLFTACATTSKIEAPIVTDVSLPTGTPESVGLVASILRNASRQIAAEDDHKLHSILVVRGGVLVFEEYYNGHGRDNPHDLRSATKSITSLLTGIAIEREHLRSVDDHMMEYLAAEYPDVQNKGDISIEHLLTMSSGLDCDDSDRGTRGQEDKMYRSQDWVAYFLSLSRPHAPGKTTRYCTGGVIALGEVIARASGQDFAHFSNESLFAPMGIANFRWARFDDERKADSGGHLLLTPQAMAKIGMLVSQKGRWGDAPLVSAEWIERSTRARSKIGQAPYGYLWWSDILHYGEKDIEVIFASGNGGQTIFVVPEYDLVAVFTAGYYNSPKSRIVFELFRGAVVPSLSELQAFVVGG